MTRPAAAQPPARLLVVDDDPRNRKLIEGYLRSEGYQVRGAEDGPTALARVSEEVPDLVLLDVMMPGMTGYEVCEILKKDPKTRICQVMLVTALDGTPNKVEGLDIGADDYVTKPVRREEFLAKVRALLRVHGLLQDLEQARSALAARNEELQLKKTLAQTLVHDLKSPLAAVLGNLDLLEMRCEEKLRYLTRRTRQGASRMQKMVLDLLDVERLEEGRLAPAIERVDARAVAAEAVEEAEVPAQSANVDLVLDGAPGAWVRADPSLLRRVLDNLLANAIAHSPRDGVVTVGVQSRDEGIELTVSDHGPGIPEEYREHVFEKYAQVNLRDAGLTANRGLGLTFCRLVVEAHGGAIWVEAAPGAGACFCAILPDAAQIESAGSPPVLVKA